MAATVRFYVQKLPDHVLKESSIMMWRDASPERCRQVALSLAIRSAFQSAFQPAFDMLLGIKLILNGRGKPYVCHILEN